MNIKYKCSDHSIALAVCNAVMIRTPINTFRLKRAINEWWVFVDGLTSAQHDTVMLYSPGAEWETV